MNHAQKGKQAAGGELTRPRPPASLSAYGERRDNERTLVREMSAWLIAGLSPCPDP